MTLNWNLILNHLISFVHDRWTLTNDDVFQFFPIAGKHPICPNWIEIDERARQVYRISVFGQLGHKTTYFRLSRPPALSTRFAFFPRLNTSDIKRTTYCACPNPTYRHNMAHAIHAQVQHVDLIFPHERAGYACVPDSVVSIWLISSPPYLRTWDLKTLYIIYSSMTHEYVARVMAQVTHTWLTCNGMSC